MDFRLSSDQEALQEGIRSFCRGRIDIDWLRAHDDTGALDRDLWAELAEMGVFGLRLPESEGGVGLRTADAVLVFEELGRCLAPGPIAWSHLAAGLVPGAGPGEVVVGGLDRQGASAGPLLIEHGGDLDVLLVLARDGVRRVDPKGLDARPVETPLDPLTPLWRLAALPDGELVAGPEVAAQLRLEGATLVAAQMLGIAEATLELAVDYAKKREQFGRTIGSFQAIKHILADMFVEQEAARAAVYAAGATLDFPEVGDAGRAVASAKVVAGDAAMHNARACIQVHGGMGYTWEIPAHYFLKRTWVLESVFGTVAEHADRLAACVEESLEARS